MSQTDTLRWKDALAVIESRVPEGIFRTWFRNLEFVEGDAEKVTLGVANRFTKAWLEKNYASLIADALESVGGARPELEFRISAELFRRLRKEQEEAAEAPIVPPAAPGGAIVAVDGPVPWNAGFRFETFHAGAAGRLALAACHRAVENPGEYNPIVLHGDHGTGKSHLLHALCHAARARDPRRQVLLLSGSTFVQELTRAHKEGRFAEFQRRLRASDLLVLDDLQTLAEGQKTASQIELQHALEMLLHGRRQIVLAADRAPAALEGLAPRLRNLLSAALTLRLPSPDAEARRALVACRAASRRLRLPADAAAWLAEEFPGGARELEGALGQLAAHAGLDGRPVTLELVRTLAAGRRAAARPPTLDEVSDAAARAFGIPVADLTGRRRHQTVRMARQAAMLLARLLTSCSLVEIGMHFGGRGHGTVRSAINGALPLRADEPFSRAVEAALVRLGREPADYGLYQSALFVPEE